MKTIKALYYDGFTIAQTNNNEFLIEDTYEYFNSLSEAKSAVDRYVAELPNPMSKEKPQWKN